MSVRTGKPDSRDIPTERRTAHGNADVVLSGKTENGGDGLIYVFETGYGWAAMERILDELRSADVSPIERSRYVQRACQKQYGPFVGFARALLYRLGQSMIDYPTLTVVGFAGIPSTDLERVYYADEALFVAKRQQRDGMALYPIWPLPVEGYYMLSMAPRRAPALAVA